MDKFTWKVVGDGYSFKNKEYTCRVSPSLVHVGRWGYSVTCLRTGAYIQRGHMPDALGAMERVEGILRERLKG